MWTQFFLLPTLLVYIVYYYSTLLMKLKNTLNLATLTILLLFLLWWVFEYYLTNSYNYVWLNVPYFYNNLLYNPLNKYHPIMFFISYIYIYSIVPYLNSFQNYRNTYYINFIVRIIHKNSTTKLNIYWLLMSISLYFGSWWALQEGSWGGWWNWDSSEVFGLVILTFFLSLTHLNYPYLTHTYYMILCYMWVTLIFFIYVILQMSYTLVSHNFGLSILDYGYVNTNFVVLCTLILILYTVTYYNVFTNLISGILLTTVYYKISTYVRRKYLLTYTTTLLIIYIYVLSFNPIINNIFWTSLNVEVLNKWFSWVNPKLTLMILIYLFFLSFNSFILFCYILTYIPYFINYSPLIFYSVFKNTKILVFHLLLFITFITSINLNNSVFIVWEYFTNSSTDYLTTKTRNPYINTLVVDNPYILNNINTLNLNHNMGTINSFFWFSTNLSNQLFLLDLSDEVLRQVIYNHTFMYSFRVYIYDMSSLVTDLLVIPILFMSTRFLKTKVLIIS
jgi:hypothetical protein